MHGWFALWGFAVWALLLGVGCGGTQPATTPAEAPARGVADEASPASATEPAPETEESGLTTCDDACTQIAVCYEEIYETDYRQGGACAESCEELSDADRAAYFTCLDSAPNCDAMMNDC